MIDYKAQAPKPLKDSLEMPGEDVQLAVYALLWGDAVTEAMFLSVDRKDVEPVAPEQDVRDARAGHPRPARRDVRRAGRGCEAARRREPRRPASTATRAACAARITGMTERAADELTARALAPEASVVIEACAGSGKTWLLVSRIVRLLLAGATPSQILAITFTRKAAQEMATRLREWLHELATVDDEKAREFLRQREVPESEIEAAAAAGRARSSSSS